MKLLICGDRNWTDKKLMGDWLDIIDNSPEEIISGGCRGADKLAEELAADRGIAMRVFLADWKRYGKAAGPIRNHKMIDDGKPDLVVAFHDNLDASRGTKNMKTIAYKANINFAVVSHSGVFVFRGQYEI